MGSQFKNRSLYTVSDHSSRVIQISQDFTNMVLTYNYKNTKNQNNLNKFII